jgi:riboflavin synthase
MFTGIVETYSKVAQQTDFKLKIHRPPIFQQLKAGQSIAVNGACLTLTTLEDDLLHFDVVPETYAKTNLASSPEVNLERALKADGRFEGHIVQGHTDGTLKFISRQKEGEGERWTLEKPASFDPYFVSKGSITLNGISLTIAKENADTFEVALIPHTLEQTNFQFLQAGDLLNFECDILAKYLEKWNQQQ